jgi:cytochrome c551/c552
MKRLSFAIARWISPICAMLTATALVHAADVQLPPEMAKLRESPLAGHAVATQKCGVCHSADYVDYQPPNMTKAQWTAEMTKMQHAYGAPISDDEVKLLGIYLTATYGDASTVSEADRAQQPVVVAPSANTAAPLDAQKLLADNGCLACHAIDKAIFGPAYRDVAAKYRSDPQAVAHVGASIVQGTAGKWGSSAMPAFANLNGEEAKALAEFVLKQ